SRCLKACPPRYAAASIPSPRVAQKSRPCCAPWPSSWTAEMATATDVTFEEQARHAAIETAEDAAAVGRLLGSEPIADAGVTFQFECHLPGYRGWVWSVDLTVYDGVATVSESALLPGDDGLLAPEWVPWSDRIRPGD